MHSAILLAVIFTFVPMSNSFDLLRADKKQKIHDNVVIMLPSGSRKMCVQYDKFLKFINRLIVKAEQHNENCVIPDNPTSFYSTGQLYNSKVAGWSKDKVTKLINSRYSLGNKECQKIGGSLPDPTSPADLAHLASSVALNNIEKQPLNAILNGDDLISPASGYTFKQNINLKDGNVDDTTIWVLQPNGEVAPYNGTALESKKFMCLSPMEHNKMSEIHQQVISSRITKYKDLVNNLIDIGKEVKSMHDLVPNNSFSQHTACQQLEVDPRFVDVFDSCLDGDKTEKLDLSDFGICVEHINYCIGNLNEWQSTFTGGTQPFHVGLNTYRVKSIHNPQYMDVEQVIFLRTRGDIVKIKGTPQFLYNFVSLLKNGTCLGTSNNPNYINGKVAIDTYETLMEECCSSIANDKTIFDCPRQVGTNHFRVMFKKATLWLYALAATMGLSYMFIIACIGKWCFELLAGNGRRRRGNRGVQYVHGVVVNRARRQRAPLRPWCTCCNDYSSSDNDNPNQVPLQNMAGANRAHAGRNQLPALRGPPYNPGGRGGQPGPDFNNLFPGRISADSIRS